MDISTINDLVLTLPMAASDPGAAYHIGTGGSHQVGRIRGLIVASTIVFLTCWAAWAIWGRFEAYWEQRIHIKALMIDVIAAGILYTVMFGLLLAGL